MQEQLVIWTVIKIFVSAAYELFKFTYLVGNEWLTIKDVNVIKYMHGCQKSLCLYRMAAFSKTQPVSNSQNCRNV